MNCKYCNKDDSTVIDGECIDCLTKIELQKQRPHTITKPPHPLNPKTIARWKQEKEKKEELRKADEDYRQQVQEMQQQRLANQQPVYGSALSTDQLVARMINNATPTNMKIPKPKTISDYINDFADAVSSLDDGAARAKQTMRQYGDQPHMLNPAKPKKGRRWR